MLTFEGLILASTPKAMLFKGNYWDGHVWLPYSQVYIETDMDSIEVVVKVKAWLCDKRGIQEFTPYSEEEMARINAR